MTSRESPEDAIDFSETWRYSDIVFIVEEQKVYANKTILSMWSPVMEAMFHSDFREKRATEIDLPDKTFEDMVELMRVLHPPNAEICANNVARLLPLLQEYQIDSLLTKCEEFLMSQGTSINNYLLAQKYNLKELEEKALSHLKRAPISRLKSEPDFDKLDKKLLIDIMMERCEKFEKCAEEMRDVRHVIERKRPNISFPGMHLLCDTCKGARDQQAECLPCLKSCCKRVAEIVRQLDRY